jgi:hypothetical protein
MNNLGQPTFSFDKSIHEYDVSVGRLQPQKIPDSVYRRLNIDRTPRVPLPTLDLGTLDRRIKFIMEKNKLDNYYNKQPQLIKEPKDTRISLGELAKKGQTLYDLYNKIQKEQSKRQREEEKKDPSLRELSTEDPGDIPEIPFEEAEVPSELEFEFTRVDPAPGMPSLDDDDYPEGKHETDEPEGFDLDDPEQWEEVPLDEPSISVTKEEVKLPSGETARRLPEKKLPEAETFDPRLIGEKPTIADIFFEEERPHRSDPTWRPIQAIETKTDIPFFIPSVVGEDPLQPSLVAPEREVMVDEPVNIHIDDEPVMIHY